MAKRLMCIWITMIRIPCCKYVTTYVQMSSHDVSSTQKESEKYMPELDSEQVLHGDRGRDFARTRTVSETTTEFCIVIKLGVRKVFTRSTVNADVRSVCGSSPAF